MFKVAVALPMGIAMSVLGQIEPAAESFPYGDLVLQGGALVVLAYAVWHAYKVEIPGMRKELREDRVLYNANLDSMAARHERMETEICDRHERWEAQRHEDSDKLESALSNLALTCAKTQKQLADDHGGPVQS